MFVRKGRLQSPVKCLSWGCVWISLLVGVRGSFFQEENRARNGEVEPTKMTQGYENRTQHSLAQYSNLNMPTQTMKLIFACIALFLGVVNATPVCTSTTKPGTVCIGSVKGVPGTKCVAGTNPTSLDCPTGLVQFLSEIVTVSSAAADHTCKTLPCCDENGKPAACVTVGVGCLAELDLCIGGSVGTLVNSILPNLLDIQLLGSPLLP